MSTSINHPRAPPSNGVPSIVLASRYLVEPLENGKSRLTHISRVDQRWGLSFCDNWVCSFKLLQKKRLKFKPRYTDFLYWWIQVLPFSQPVMIALGLRTFEKGSQRNNVFWRGGRFVKTTGINCFLSYTNLSCSSVMLHFLWTKSDRNLLSPSTVPKYNFGTTARLWLWYNRGGTFIIPILRDKFNTPIVILNWPSVRYQVTRWWDQIKLKETSWSIAFIFLMAASIFSRPEIVQTNLMSHNPRAFPISLPLWNWS